MLVVGSTVACFVKPNMLVVKGVVVIRTLLVCPRGTCVLVSCLVDPIPAIGLGRNPLAVSDPRFISIEFVFHRRCEASEIFRCFCCWFSHLDAL